MATALAILVPLLILGALFIAALLWMLGRAYKQQKATIGFRVQGYTWPSLQNRRPPTPTEKHDPHE